MNRLPRGQDLSWIGGQHMGEENEISQAVRFPTLGRLLWWIEGAVLLPLSPLFSVDPWTTTHNNRHLHPAPASDS
jgi:hypothetical protein